MCIHFLLLPHVQHLILLQTDSKSFFPSSGNTSFRSISCRKHWHAEIVVTWTRLLKAHITLKYCRYSRKKCSDFLNNFVLKPNTFNGTTTIPNYFCIHSPPIFSLVCRMKKKISTLGTGSTVAFFFFFFSIRAQSKRNSSHKGPSHWSRIWHRKLSALREAVQL